MAINWENENNAREKAVNEALKIVLEKYLNEETSEEERIIDYKFTGYRFNGYGIEGTLGENIESVDVSINYNVTPYSENSSKWKENYRYICFATLKYENEEYIVEDVREIPEKYEEFMERYEEYLATSTDESQTETIAVQAEENNYEEAKVIEKINFGVFGACLVVFVVCIAIFIKVIKK